MSTKQQLTFQILLIGSTMVGKTSILKQYFDSNINNIQSTIGIDLRKKNVIINNQTVTLQFWDIDGHENHQPRCIFQKKDCCIIVYNNEDEEPIKTLDYWKNLYLESIDSKDSENVPIFVIQNNFVENNEIIKSQLVEWWCKQNRVKQLFEVSVKDNLVINETFIEIAKILFKQKQNIMSKANHVINQIDDSPNVLSSEYTIVKSQLKCNMQEKIILLNVIISMIAHQSQYYLMIILKVFKDQFVLNAQMIQEENLMELILMKLFQQLKTGRIISLIKYRILIKKLQTVQIITLAKLCKIK
ncbi:unnamed protein product [Paramecium pentaurelia]|uniref:Uncharacterized protein n=1 Tax=Paramecium pentaurelia TaxID=43138 RepID=A0A8S1XV17_9CILI|nr:unnamed protein product [Paramecium pentaurelia]